MTPILVVSPSHRVCAQLPIAANRAGETGILDLGYSSDVSAIRREIRALRRHARHPEHWGVRWDGLDSPARSFDLLRSILGEERVPLLFFTGIAADEFELTKVRQQARSVADQVHLEITSFEQAQWAEKAGCDGIIARGFEAGGRVSLETTPCLLQRLSGKTRLPFWVQGGIGPDTAASALLAGAAGVVLCEQVWLASETSLSAWEKAKLAALDGSETVTVYSERRTYRFFSTRQRDVVRRLDESHVTPSEWQARLLEGLTAPRPLIPCGQDIGQARPLADKHVNVAGIIRAYRLRAQENFKMACRGESLAPDSPLAESHRTKYPIIQGPMTGITDEPEFCRLVAEAGALPFLSLGRWDVDEARARLLRTKELLADHPWGAALSYSCPSTLAERHLQLIAEVQPPYAIVDAREADEALSLTAAGIATYLHVDAPELLIQALAGGHRRFIVEGNECAGPLGPRSSFSLWQSAIDILLSAKLRDPEEVHVVFGGPIHDSLSSALTAAAVAPLTARGMKVGVQVGSAYFFTPEAVQGGAIVEEFHRTILACEEIVHLQPGDAPTIRAARTPFVEEFDARRTEALRQEKTPHEIAETLTRLADERLQLAVKGRRGDEVMDLDYQRRHGLYRLGEAAILRHRPVPMRDLHEEISQESVVLLEKLAADRLPWHPETRPLGPKSEDIAIVGMACKFPKAEDLRHYWENICRSVDAIQEVDEERWSPDEYFDADRLARDRVYSKWGGFLDKVVFDPMKWRIPPAALKAIEPIQLLALEVAWDAMLDAGYDRREYPRERTGVLFACAGSHDLGSAYAFRTMLRQYLPKVESLTAEARQQLEESLNAVLPEWTEDSFPGFLLNVVAGRVARELNVNGPNYTVDAACAASLAAFHAAIEQLRSGTSDMMLVGGVDWGNNPMCYMSFSKTHALSPRGRSRPFDESGDGIGLGEGIGVVLMKRLKDAERDGDRIYCVIKGIGSSSDGKNKSLTAPHPPGQIKAVERAYEDARICPTSITLIEAHGTGTVVGDSAEITTLSEVFGSRTDERRFAAVGSVKSMIGHTKTVAGMASMIKTALALKHRVLPPTIGVERPTSRFDFAESPFYVNSQTRPWIEDRGDHPRRAGVSAFGFGGTNFHVVLEEYTGGYLTSDANYTPRSAEIFVWGSETKDEIVRRVSALSAHLAEVENADLAGVAAVVASECSENRVHPCRLGIVASSTEELHKRLDRALILLVDRSTVSDPTGIFYSEADPVRPGEVCFLYPGQGSQYVDMLRDLFIGFPRRQDVFTTANRILDEFLPERLSRYVYPPPTFSEEEAKEAFRALSDTRVAQPALGVVELFATDLLDTFGVRPGMTAGHSYGEHVALYAAGVLSRHELIELSALRGQVCADIAAASPGGMAALQADADTATGLIKEAELSVYLANLNAPDQTIIAGSEADIERAVAEIAARGVRAKRIPVSAPFHTPLLEAGAHAMAEHFADATFHRPKLPVYSNTTGARHSDDPDAIRDLLARHFSEPVHFATEVKCLYRDGARVFVEVGPGKVLSELVGRILKEEAVATVPIDIPGRDGWTQFGHAIARLYVLGLPVAFSTWFAGRSLAPATVAAHFEALKAKATPKRSDWILGPSRVEPAYPPAASSNGKKDPAPVIGVVGSENPGQAPAAATVPPPVWPASPAAAPIETTTPAIRISTPLVSASVAAAPRHQGVTAVPAAELSLGRSMAALEAVQSASPARTAGMTNLARATSRRSLARPGSDLLSTGTRLTGQLRSQPRTTRNAVTMTPTPHSEDGYSAPTGQVPGTSGAELFLELQSSTRMLLEFQHGQQLLMERFLETQERLLGLCLGRTPIAAPAAVTIASPVAAPIPVPQVAAPPPYSNGQLAAAPPVMAAPAPAAMPAQVPVARAPIAIPTGRTPATAPPAAIPTVAAPPRPAPAAPPVMDTPKVAAPAPPKAAPAPVSTPAAPVSAPATAAASTDGPPSVEEFRRDLLAVISERTGYPEDMLDEDLPLEAGLGIDSIKTVEVFSTLKKYHGWMRDEERDEEETLAEFTRLKTIRDILDAYRGRVEKHEAAGTAGKKSVVERHAVTAIEAPLGEGSSKKNSLAST